MPATYLVTIYTQKTPIAGFLTCGGHFWREARLLKVAKITENSFLGRRPKTSEDNIITGPGWWPRTVGQDH